MEAFGFVQKPLSLMVPLESAERARALGNHGGVSQHRLSYSAARLSISAAAAFDDNRQVVSSRQFSSFNRGSGLSCRRNFSPDCNISKRISILQRCPSAADSDLGSNSGHESVPPSSHRSTGGSFVSIDDCPSGSGNVTQRGRPTTLPDSEVSYSACSSPRREFVPDSTGSNRLVNTNPVPAIAPVRGRVPKLSIPPLPLGDSSYRTCSVPATSRPLDSVRMKGYGVSAISEFISGRYKESLKRDASAASAATALVTYFKERGIKIVAADFDRTMTTVHSGGHINPNVDIRSILTSLAPDFNEFGRRVEQEEGLKLVCATFSDEYTIQSSYSEIAGDALVRAVLKASKADFSVEKVYGFFPDNYQEEQHYQTLGLSAPMTPHKSYHLQRICEEYGCKPGEVVLIDDDARNCADASANGHPAIYVKSREGFCFRSLKGI
eukprot:GHVU01155403.1.p1 GENE.GHVU01155403.1~~GHVU01155403.1.p1  ORF type:complete len:438 (+),score=30.45 GHVU01155403.1:198-1511(+)